MLRISFDTSCIGKPYLYFPICVSTNEFVMQKLATASLSEGSLVLADYQTRGRGQRHNTWESAAGLNLTFTVALFPGIPVEQQFYLNMMTSLAITDCLADSLGDALKIKWPNDIYYSQAKICGILIQNNLKVNKIHSSAVGVGLNVNQVDFGLGGAMSLKMISGSVWDRTALLKSLAVGLENRYFQLKAGQVAALRRAYLQRLYRKDEWHLFRDEEGMFRGVIIGVNEAGQLLIQKEKKLQAYGFKEVVFLN